MPDNADPPVYRALVALKPDDLKLGPWAEKAGLARNYFNDLRKHGNPGDRALAALLKEIGRTRADLDAFTSPVRTEVAGTGITSSRDVRRTFFSEPPDLSLPLLGTAVGGEEADLDDDVELTELHLGEVLDYLARPASLANDRDAYALTIVGVSMSPRYRPGERVGVSPRSPVGVGDDVIVQLRTPDVEGERITMVLIKELVRRTGSFVELRQYNPERVFRVEAHRVAAMHRVRGNFF